MKIVSWNINGLNNILLKAKNGYKHQKYSHNNVLSTLAKEVDPDIICLQEVRCSTSLELLTEYFEDIYPFIYINCCKSKKGYSGTALLSKFEPDNVYYDMEMVYNDEDLNDEGRIIRADFQNFTVINVYTPNSKTNLERLEYRYSKWEPCFRDVIKFHKKREIILCGDLNVAHNDIDLYSHNSNHYRPGYTDKERLSFGLLLHNMRMIDAFRYQHPKEIKYSWWSNFANSREKNNGWRIDYFILDRTLIQYMNDCDILTEYYGSDHAPVYLDIEISA